MGDRDKELASLRGLVESLTGMKLPEPGQGGDALGEIDVLTDALARVEKRLDGHAGDLSDLRTDQDIATTQIAGLLEAVKDLGKQIRDLGEHDRAGKIRQWKTIAKHDKEIRDQAESLRAILARLDALEKRLSAPEVQPTTTDTFADPSYLNAMRAMWDSLDDPLAHAPTPTVFPPSEDDVTRAYERGLAEGNYTAKTDVMKQVTDAYERGIAEGRRQELRRVLRWVRDRTENQILSVREIVDLMDKWLRDANGEEVSNG